MQAEELGTLEAEILKALYCMAPHHDPEDPEVAESLALGFFMVSKDLLELEMHVLALRFLSDLPRKLNPAVCLPRGVFRFIQTQLKHPRIIPESEDTIDREQHVAFHEAIVDLVARGLVTAYVSGYRIAVGEDGTRLPVPLPWTPQDREERIIGVCLTQKGFRVARELMQGGP